MRPSTQRLDYFIGSEINKTGCFFLSIINKYKPNSTVKDVLVFYRKCIEAGVMNKHCYLKNPAEVANIVIGEKRFKGNKICDPKKGIPKGDILCKSVNHKTGATHFHDINWDSWYKSKEDRENAGFKLSQYRLFY